MIGVVQRSRAAVDAVKAKVDLAELVGRDVALSAVGSVLKGSSPERRDTDPSFVVWPDTQTWRDFSGGGTDGGDCFDYVMLRDRCDFRAALRLLAEETGVALDTGELAERELEQAATRRRLEQLLTAAARHYHQSLHEEVRDEWYRKRYGFTDETVDRLELGYAGGALRDHLRRTVSASDDEMLATGLFMRSEAGHVRDFFEGRLVFPYWRGGRVVYFIGRATQHTPEWDKAKYKKLLTKSDKHPYVSDLIQNTTFYGEDDARGAHELLVTEGVTDCILANQEGFPCISPVTTRFNKKSVPRLLLLAKNAERVLICNDAEENDAGNAGAIDTAQALTDAGCAVRIATLPRPDGVEKVDLNDYLREHGADDAKTLFKAAPDLIEHQLGEIAAGTAKRDLGRAVKQIVERAGEIDGVQRDAYAELLAERFDLRMPVARDLFKVKASALPPASSGGAGDSDETRDASEKGRVYEWGGRYCTQTKQGEFTAISSFVLRVKERIVADGEELIIADAITQWGTTIPSIRLARPDWNSKAGFLRALKSLDLTWKGNDENVQALLDVVRERAPKPRIGARAIGYHETPGGPLWLLPECTISAGADASSLSFVPRPSNRLLGRFAKIAPDETAGLARAVLPRLLELNQPECILPIIGWFFAAPLRPRIMKALGNFPTLFVWGTRGMGKSTLILDVFWPLFGANSRGAGPKGFSINDTEFSRIALLTSSNAFPVFIDEYKPRQIRRQRLDQLHTHIRVLYGGEELGRGNADQTVTRYDLTTPLCIAGESRPMESAILERIVSAHPNVELAGEGGASYRAAFQALRAEPVHRLTHSILEFLLSRDTDSDLAEAAKEVNRHDPGAQLPSRVRTNLTVVALGLTHFLAYADDWGIELPELDFERVVDAHRDELLEGGEQTKTGLDYFIEILGALATRGAIRYRREYTYTGEQLAIHFPSCLAAYHEHCKRTDYEGEVFDKCALLSLIRENERGGGYVTERQRATHFSGSYNKKRALIIDMTEAKAVLDVDDFPQGSAYECGAGDEDDPRYGD